MGWQAPDEFRWWFVPPDFVIVLYEHDDYECKVVLRNNLDEERKYYLIYERFDENEIIQLTGNQYLNKPGDLGDDATFTATFKAAGTMCQGAGAERPATFVRLLIRYPVDEARYSAQGSSLNDFWAAAFERYVKRAATR